jgi:PHD/YefM family antitoxin component YafN of YafNO toxin-antitoxin module
MAKTISSTELQKNTREIIDWTRTKGEAVVIETYGKPMAAILSYDEYQAYVVYKQTRPVESGKLASERTPTDLKGLLLQIGRECAALPLLDHRTAEEIIGYDSHGVPA